MKILFLTSRFPFPLEKGDKLRAYFQLKELASRHEIILMSISDKPVSDADLNELKPFCRKISIHFIGKRDIFFNLFATIIKNIPFQVGYFFSKKFKIKIEKFIRTEKPDVVYCQLPRMAQYVIDINNQPKMIDYMDAFSKGLERLVSKVAFYKKPFVWIEYRRMKNYEAKIFNDFNAHSIISKQDSVHINHSENSRIRVIPNGVDLNFYTPKTRTKKYDLLFAGNMAYPPNIESALYIAHKIVPLLIKQNPDIKIAIAGADPVSAIKNLESKNITVTGWVDDIRTYFYESKIHLAPMLISIGMQNKILQAMAMKIPTITTSLANNAIHATHNKNILIADTPEQFVISIFSLLHDSNLCEKITANAHTFVQATYNWQLINHILEEELQRISSK